MDGEYLKTKTVVVENADTQPDYKAERKRAYTLELVKAMAGRISGMQQVEQAECEYIVSNAERISQLCEKAGMLQ